MKAEATRATILGAAVELGSLQGLEELSLGRLSTAVGMSKSGLFAHFGSKEELQLATIAQAWEMFDTQVLVNPRGDALAGLDALLERWLSFHERKIFLGGCFFAVSAVEFAGRGDAVSRALASAVSRQTAALEAAVREAIESGELRIARDPGRTAFGLFSILTNADALFQIDPDPAVFDRARALIAELLGQRDAFRELS